MCYQTGSSEQTVISQLDMNLHCYLLTLLSVPYKDQKPAMFLQAFTLLHGGNVVSQAAYTGHF